jgi:hypothetical protein
MEPVAFVILHEGVLAFFNFKTGSLLSGVERG